ncbi:MAG: secretin N-terminal domain-containing protein [Candidatus Omnitrophota bacterium]
MMKRIYLLALVLLLTVVGVAYNRAQEPQPAASAPSSNAPSSSPGAFVEMAPSATSAGESSLGSSSSSRRRGASESGVNVQRSVSRSRSEPFDSANVDNESDIITKVYKLTYAKAAEIQQLYERIFPECQAVVDVRTNSIVFSGPASEAKKLDAILAQLDTAPAGRYANSTRFLNADFGQGLSDIAFRVIAVEACLITADKKEFSLELRFPGWKELNMDEILPESVTANNIRCDRIMKKSTDGKEYETMMMQIQGESQGGDFLNEIVKTLKEKTETDVLIESVNVTHKDSSQLPPLTLNLDIANQIPNNVRSVVGEFLGSSFQPVGCWIGQAACPGLCRTTLGPWQLEMDIKAGNEGYDVLLSLILRYPNNDDLLLDNTINIKIGRPIVVGYTRESDETFIPGALIVIPSNDLFEKTDAAVQPANPQQNLQPMKR